MKKVKKYYPGTESLYANTGGWSYGLNGNSGMTNPGNQTLKQTTTTSSSTIPTGSLPASGNISQLTNPLKKASSGGEFSDLMGGMKGMDIGGMASSIGGSLAMMINANKKKDPNPEVPYKKGTNMIKYQGNKSNTKTSKSKFIKYQEGNEYLQSGKGMNNVLNAMQENNNNLSNASIKPEEFDMSSLNDYMPDIPKRQSPQPIQVGPSKKEMSKLMREYNKKEFEAGRFGNMDKSDPRYKQLATRKEANTAREEYEKSYSQMENDYKKLKNNYKESEPLSTKTPLLNLKLAQTAELPSNLNKIPVKEQSRRERKAESKKLEAMAKAPITYNESSFVGPRQGTPITDALLKSTMSSQAFKDVTSKQPVSKTPITYKKGDFNTFTAEEKKKYREGIASGKEFSIGDRKYGAATSAQQAQSSKMANKGNKPLVKMKGDSSEKRNIKYPLPGYKESKPIYEFDTIVKDKEDTQQKNTNTNINTNKNNNTKKNNVKNNVENSPSTLDALKRAYKAASGTLSSTAFPRIPFSLPF